MTDGNVYSSVIMTLFTLFSQSQGLQGTWSNLSTIEIILSGNTEHFFRGKSRVNANFAFQGFQEQI